MSLTSREVLGGFLLHLLGEAEPVQNVGGARLRRVRAEFVQALVHVHKLLLRVCSAYTTDMRTHYI